MYRMSRVSFSCPSLVSVSVPRAFSLCVALVLMLLVWEVNVTYMYVMPRMVGVLFSGKDFTEGDWRV